MPDNENNERLRLQQAYRKLFSGEDGRIVLDDLAAKFYIHRSTVDIGCDSVCLACREGQRGAVLYILEWLELDVKDKIKNLDEINKEAEADHKL